LILALANLHLLRGDDQYSVKLRVQQIQASLGSDFDAAMNLSRLDGRSVPIEEMRTAVSTLPFFGSRRLVIIDQPLGKSEKSRQEPFTAMLNAVRPTTHLVLVVEDHQKWRRTQGGWQQVWEMLNDSHWLVKWFNANPQSEIIDAGLPDARRMPAWITNEAKRQGGKIEPAAASELSEHTGNDTSIASQEIAKLLMYVDFKRAVTREDVLELVSAEGSADVFDMLDRLMTGQTREAQAMMRRLLDDSQPEIILGAVIHRFRQLLLVSETLEYGEDPADAARKLGILPKRVVDYTNAARRYGPDKLERLYHHLLEIDLQAKTSQADLASNLELLVLETNN
jgi:DNA polymerase-3 subunit delta